MSLAVKNRNHKCVGQTVTYQRCNGRAQARFIVIDTRRFADEIKKPGLLIDELFQRFRNVG